MKRLIKKTLVFSALFYLICFSSYAQKNYVYANVCPDKYLVARENVRYGTVKKDVYFSTTCNRERKVNLLLPASYDGTQDYPVIFFLHGIFENESTFTDTPSHRIKEIAGNMFEDNILPEALIVFPDIYATKDPSLKPSFAGKAVLNYDNFINELEKDLLPYIERKYTVKNDRKSRAIVGFSMGGREAMYISIARPELFAYVGSISAAPGLVPAKDWAGEHVGQLQEAELAYKKGMEPDFLMICTGTADTTVSHFPKDYHNMYAKNGVEHLWYEMPGVNHDFRAIRSGWYSFLSNIFK